MDEFMADIALPPLEKTQADFLGQEITLGEIRSVISTWHERAAYRILFDIY